MKRDLTGIVCLKWLVPLFEVGSYRRLRSFLFLEN